MDLTSYDVQLLREEILMLAAITRAKARIDGMNAENQQRERRGESLAYVEKNFTDVIAEEDIDQSTVIERLYHRV